MSSPESMAERHGRVLERLSELGLSLAETAHEKALAAETPAELRDMALTFHRISRSVRQSLALEAKLVREGLQAERVQRAADDQARDIAQLEAARRVRDRKESVTAELNPLIWTEADEDEDEADALFCDLKDLLEQAADEPGFLETPIDTLVARLAADLRLGAEAPPYPGEGPGAPIAPPPPPPPPPPDSG